MKLPTNSELMKSGFLYGKKNSFANGNPETEWLRTNPDFLVFNPQKPHEGSNEHFLVFDIDGQEGYFALWTQDCIEGGGESRICFARSNESGTIWSKPTILAGKLPDNDNLQAKWQFPLISKSGRIYVLYHEQVNVKNKNPYIFGRVKGIYSDDYGKTWSKSRVVNWHKTRFDDSDKEVPTSDIICQKPLRFSDDKYYVGYTKFTSLAVEKEEDFIGHPQNIPESHCFFMRFENIDENPDIEDIKITWLPDNDNGLAVPYNKTYSNAEEACLVELPDKRLYCSMRCVSGAVYYSVSSDRGHTWTMPKPLCFSDGSKFIHPLSPAMIYDLKDGRYMQMYHGTTFEGEDIYGSRHPLRCAFGTFAPNEEQPIKFEKSQLFMDLDNVMVGPRKFPELSMYSSFTCKNGQRILWYPDRKYYLLGKII